MEKKDEEEEWLLVPASKHHQSQNHDCKRTHFVNGDVGYDVSAPDSDPPAAIAMCCLPSLKYSQSPMQRRTERMIAGVRAAGLEPNPQEPDPNWQGSSL